MIVLWFKNTPKYGKISKKLQTKRDPKTRRKLALAKKSFQEIMSTIREIEEEKKANPSVEGDIKNMGSTISKSVKILSSLKLATEKKFVSVRKKLEQLSDHMSNTSEAIFAYQGVVWNEKQIDRDRQMQTLAMNHTTTLDQIRVTDKHLEDFRKQWDHEFKRNDQDLTVTQAKIKNMNEKKRNDGHKYTRPNGKNGTKTRNGSGLDQCKNRSYSTENPGLR